MLLLERLILPDEKVLDVISRWTTWPLEERALNFLIVKLDFVTDRVKNMVCVYFLSAQKSFRRKDFRENLSFDFIKRLGRRADAFSDLRSSI